MCEVAHGGGGDDKECDPCPLNGANPQLEGSLLSPMVYIYIPNYGRG